MEYLGISMCLFYPRLKSVMLWVSSIILLSASMSVNALTLPCDFSNPLSVNSLVLLMIWWLSSVCVVISLANYTKQFLIIMLCLLVTISFQTDYSIWFYLSFESCLVPMLVLLVGYGPQPERTQAAMSMMLYTILSSLPFLALIISYKSLTFTNYYPVFIYSGWVSMILLIPFMVKLPSYLVHLWLPKAHVEAPVIGSMLLASLLLKLGLIGIWRCGSLVTVIINSSLSCLLLLGGVFSVFICVTVTDLKMVVAYCSIFHMAPAGATMFMGAASSLNAWLMIMLAHGFVSPFMFYLATLLYTTSGSRSLILNQGLLMLFPVFSFLWGLTCVMNISVPPLLGVIGEILCVYQYGEFSTICLVIMGIIVFASICVFIYLYSSLTHGTYLDINSSKLDSKVVLMSTVSMVCMLLVTMLFIG